MWLIIYVNENTVDVAFYKIAVFNHIPALHQTNLNKLQNVDTADILKPTDHIFKMHIVCN
jgi:hypothetical protein